MFVDVVFGSAVVALVLIRVFWRCCVVAICFWCVAGGCPYCFRLAGRLQVRFCFLLFGSAVLPFCWLLACGGCSVVVVLGDCVFQSFLLPVSSAQGTALMFLVAFFSLVFWGRLHLGLMFHLYLLCLKHL